MIIQKRLAFFFCAIILFHSCSDSMVYHKLRGETMGTYYTLTYELSEQSNPQEIKRQVDNLLIEINDEVSTYIEHSTISQFNSSDTDYILEDHKGHFFSNLDHSADLYERTDGYFDPTVMPLVNYWGFGYTPKKSVTTVDSSKIDSIMIHVGFNKLNYKTKAGKITLENFDGQLDFSAIAKGYAVDQIAILMNELNSDNYYIDIGGEIIVKGINDKGSDWVIGINTPKSDAQLDDLIEYLSVTDIGMASSGNYRNYHEVDGRKYGHTINPKTGYPEKNELLAVTVIAQDCMTADAIATACMTMGYDLGQDLIQNSAGIEACFFTGSEDGAITKTYSDGFIQYVIRG